MTSQNYALIDTTGKVVNVIVADSTFVPPNGEQMIAVGASGAGIGWTYSAGVFTPPPAPVITLTLAEAQAAQSASLSADCGAAIVAGFTSSALGSANIYPSDPTTQGNIDRAAVHGGTIWCESSAGVWSLAQHTAAQALQVQADLWTYIQNCQSKLATLKAQVAAATTVSAVEAVVWS